MFKHFGLNLACVLLAAGFAAGCKPKSSAGPANPSAYFKTPFQNESQFIVEAIVSDVAEQMFYAASSRLPDKKHFSVTATEKSGSPVDAPVYELQIRLDPKQSDVNLEVNINGPIWSPVVYQTVAEQLARAVKLSAGGPGKSEDTTLLSKLTDSSAETLEQENQNLSAALEKDFRNPELHEKAALLLGAFLLREHSGQFFEIRSPLSRMTAHLAMARFLRGGACGINGQTAEAILLTLIGDEGPALERLDAIGTNNAAVTPMIRALRTRNTGDYRSLGKMDGLSRMESVEWFSAMANGAGAPEAWPKLGEAQQQAIDFVRAANQSGYSVEIGHRLLAVSIPLELQEIGSVYKLSHPQEMNQTAFIPAMNELPERCFSIASGGEVHVRVIGWGQWAMFLQRHLCHAVQQNFHFMAYMWGVPDDAKEFAAQCERSFGGIRLYPFVRRFNCTDLEGYHKSVDDGFKVTVETPQLVSAQCWNYLCYEVSFAPLYHPVPNPHVNEWHNHNPLPGTVYDLNPRLNHPSLVTQRGVLAHFEQLHEMAPHDYRIANFILGKKYHNRPTYDQAMALYGPVLPYTVTALQTVAGTVQDKPEQYEHLMLQASELNPAYYYNLADYAWGRKEEDKSVQYLEKACAADPDSVRVSNHADWRVRYYLKKGQTDKARVIADEAGEVYSFAGLEAKAYFLEATTNYDGAFEWYAKIEERYNNLTPLINFCLRYKSQTGDKRFEPEVQKRIAKLFPKGIEKVSVNAFHGPPTDGVSLKDQNDLVRAAGLKAGDVIVAVYGVRVHNTVQYTYGRGLSDTPELDLIVWQGDAYREFKPSLPDHLFGVDIGDYQPR